MRSPDDDDPKSSSSSASPHSPSPSPSPSPPSSSASSSPDSPSPDSPSPSSSEYLEPGQRYPEPDTPLMADTPLMDDAASTSVSVSASGVSGVSGPMSVSGPVSASGVSGVSGVIETSANPDDAPILPLVQNLDDAVGVRRGGRAARAKSEPTRGRFDDGGDASAADAKGDRREGDGDVDADGDRDDRDGARGDRGGRRTTVVAAVTIVVGLSIAALIFLGRANSQRLLLVCSASQVTAEQGRAFPPWGSHAIAGAEWKPIALPPNAECKPRETDDRSELSKWYLELLVERATTTLTSRTLLEPPAANVVQPVNPLDTVSEQLAQALLLARDPDRRDQRKEIERLQGDVDYWRASQRLRDASTVLVEAAKQFEAAAAQRPRHVSDAAAWAQFTRKLVDDLRAGPNGVSAGLGPTGGAGAATNGATTGSGSVPVGVALPVEPGTGSAAPEPPPAPDAGVPSGGVLL